MNELPLLRRLALTAAPHEVVAQLRAALADRQLELVVDSEHAFRVRRRGGAVVRGQLRATREGSQLLLDYAGQAAASLWLGFFVALALVGLVAVRWGVGQVLAVAGIPLMVVAMATMATWVRRERRRGQEFARVAGEVARAVQPMLTAGEGQPYRALPRAEPAAPASAAPASAATVVVPAEFQLAWVRSVSAPPAAVLAHLRAALAVPEQIRVDHVVDRGLALSLTQGGRTHDFFVEVRPREQGCALEVGFARERVNRGALRLFVAFEVYCFLAVLATAGAAILELCLGLFGLALVFATAISSAHFHKVLLGIVTRQIERALATLPAPEGQGASDRALGAGEGGEAPR